MTRHINLSQFRSRLRQVQSKQRQAINKYNQKLRELKSSVDRYNREVRTYNTRLRTHQQRVRMELTRFQQQRSSRYVAFHSSVSRLHSTYTRLERSGFNRTLSGQENLLLDLSERENANSLNVLNTLLDSEDAPTEPMSHLQQTTISDELTVISPDLDSRWRGALYSLSPDNPDASRHFCASVREIFTEILELRAPDDSVENLFPDCDKTELGKPTRRSKITFLLRKKELDNEVLAEFIDEDIDNIIELFNTLNKGTHGAAGRYDLSTLASIKRRVEDSLGFLSRIAT